jgi:hypothetical protein
MEDRRQWLEWLKTTGFGSIVDVPDWKELTIAALGEDHWEARCRGVPLSEFDALLFLGTPGAFSLPSPSDRERVYIHMEWEVALLAAMAGLPPGRVVNPGFVLSWNRSLFDPVHTLRDLARLGWWTPTTRRYFDFVTGLVCKEFDPTPVEGEKRLMVVTARDVLFGDRPDEPIPSAYEPVARATQKQLSVWGLHWVTLAVSLVQSRAAAFGLQPDLPECLPAEVAGQLVNRALAASEQPQGLTKCC